MGPGWEDMAVVTSVVLMAILMPLTFSIAAGRAKNIKAGTYVITGFGCLWMIISFI